MAVGGLACIGVLGGMGPAATAEFFSALIRSAERRGLHQRLRVIVDNNPSLPDRTRAIKGLGASPAEGLADMTHRLLAHGADVLAMPCNAAHAFRSAIDAVAPHRLVSIIDASTRAAADAVKGDGIVGVMATEGTLRARLYHDALSALGLSVAVPTEADQAKISASVAAVQAAKATDADRADMIAAAHRLVEGGAGCVIAGCTEIPILLDQRALAVPLINSSDVLVEDVLSRAEKFSHDRQA
jgi:aspartate racemase